MPEDALERDGNDGKEEDGDEVKSDWDASSENDDAQTKPAVAKEVKDSWDASSGEEDKDSEDDEEQEEEQKSAPTPKPGARTAATSLRKGSFFGCSLTND
jgi:translation initiation factor 5B